MQTRFFCLSQRHLHDFFGDALDLDVHLQGGHACIGTGHLKVYIAEMILIPSHDQGVPDGWICVALR